MTDPTPLRKLQQALDGWSRFEDTAHVFFSVLANSDVKSFLSMGELREIVEACTEGRSALLDIVRERYGLLPPWPRDRAARGLSPHKDIKRLPVSDQWSKASTDVRASIAMPDGLPNPPQGGQLYSELREAARELLRHFQRTDGVWESNQRSYHASFDDAFDRLAKLVDHVHIFRGGDER